MVLTSHILNVGVEVSWRQGSYTGVEGSVVSVCALKQEQTQRGFAVSIAIPDNAGMYA